MAFKSIAWLGSWQGLAAGGALAFAAGSGAGIWLGTVMTTADLQTELTEATREVARLNEEKAGTALAALETLNDLAIDARQAQSAAEAARVATQQAAAEFGTQRGERVSAGQAEACLVSDDDAAAARLLDSRLFAQPD